MSEDAPTGGQRQDDDLDHGHEPRGGANGRTRQDQPTDGGPNADAGKASTPVIAASLGPSSVTTVLAVVSALATGALLVALADEATTEALGYFTARPTDTFAAGWDAIRGAYAALFRGSLGSLDSLSETLLTAGSLILAGLAVAVPFRAGLFNIGGEGQVIVGGAAAGWAGFGLAGLPLLVHLPLALLAGLAAGAAFGAIPGLLKARTGAHEVITTIMFNNIAAPLLLALLVYEGFQQPGRSDPISRRVLASATLPSPEGFRVDAGILVAVLATAVVWFLMSRSTLGFQIKAVGANPTAARTAGMRGDTITVVTFAFAGAFAGLAGAAIVLSASAGLVVTPGFSAGIGFDGITVALLGRGRAWGTLGAGLVFGALSAGGLEMQASTGTPIDLIIVIQALVILFIAAPLLIQSLFRLRAHGDSVGGAVAKGWGA